jgi:hypothetical protein
MTAPDLPDAVLRRKAVVYVRQSTQAQVQTNTESRRRQYELVEAARRRGCTARGLRDTGLQPMRRGPRWKADPAGRHWAA